MRSAIWRTVVSWRDHLRSIGRTPMQRRNNLQDQPFNQAAAADGAVVEGDDCVILGSGRSLLRLTATERDYLSRHPRVLAMNKYLLFWEKLGVLPSAMFLADTKPSGVRVFHETLRILGTLERPLPYYVNADFFRLFVEPTDRAFIKATRRWWKADYGYEPEKGVVVSYPLLRPFLVETEQKTFRFGSNLNEVLYHRRGSLTTAINLAAVIWPRATIKLLGIDLSDPGYFFDEELQAQWPELIDPSYERTKREGQHATALPTAAFEGTVQEGLRAVNEHLGRMGTQLFCCNAESLLVRDGVCDYAPLMADIDP